MPTEGSTLSQSSPALWRSLENSKMSRLDMSSREVVEYAAQGDQHDAFFELGLSCCTGRDGTIDLIEAHKWFNIAAMRGNDDAKRYRLELARDMSKAEIIKAQRRAREWLSSVH
jgi:TPR repeat protein